MQSCHAQLKLGMARLLFPNWRRAYLGKVLTINIKRSALLTVLISACIISCGTPNPLRSTPQATTESYWTAMFQEDWELAFVCILPEQRLLQLGATLVGATFALEDDEEKHKSFKSLLKQHGLTEKDLLQALHQAESSKTLLDRLAEVNDPAEFYADLMNWLIETTPGSEAARFVEEIRRTRPKIKVTKVEVDGDTATVYHETEPDDEERGGGSFSVLKKQGDKWYLDLAKTRERQNEARSKEIMEKYRPSGSSDSKKSD